MTTIALPRPRNVLLDRLRTIQIGVAARGAVGAGLATQRGGAIAAPTPWYRAGGAPAAYGAYQAVGAANYAASIVNLQSPGTRNLTHTSIIPTWDAVNGWQVKVANDSRLKTTFSNASTDWTLLVRWKGLPSGHQDEAAALYGTFSSGIQPRWALTDAPRYEVGSSDWWGYLPHAEEAVDVIAGTSIYRNGSLVATLNPTNRPSGITSLELPRSWMYQAFSQNILAVAMWDTSANHSSWVPAVSAAVAAL